MAGPTEPISITEIVDLLEDRKNKTPKIALVLGSRAGGLFRSDSLHKELQYYSNRAFAGMKPWERFSECYTVLQQNNGELGKNELVEILKNALNEISVSKGDSALAELIKQNIFKIIISANIDELLYTALVTLDMKEGRDFSDFSLTSPSHLVEQELFEEVLHSNKPDACKIIHISDEAKKLVYNLNQPDVQEANARFVQRLLERLRIKEVIVVGLDPNWDSALLSALPAKIKTLWFINEDTNVMYEFLLKNPGVEQCRYIAGENGSYEKFLVALYWSMNKGILPHDDLLLDVLGSMRAVQHQQTLLQNQLKLLEGEMMDVKSILKNLQHLIEKSDKDNT